MGHRFTSHLEDSRLGGKPRLRVAQVAQVQFWASGSPGEHDAPDAMASRLRAASPAMRVPIPTWAGADAPDVQAVRVQNAPAFGVATRFDSFAVCLGPPRQPADTHDALASLPQWAYTAHPAGPNPKPARAAPHARTGHRGPGTCVACALFLHGSLPDLC